MFINDARDKVNRVRLRLEELVVELDEVLDEARELEAPSESDKSITESRSLVQKILEQRETLMTIVQAISESRTNCR
jgi:hypothetical protein